MDIGLENVLLCEELQQKKLSEKEAVAIKRNITARKNYRFYTKKNASETIK